jgi:hypothetical protein
MHNEQTVSVSLLNFQKKIRMFTLVCQKFVCMCVCVFVYGHFCGLISQRIWMKLGTKQDDDAYKKKW